MSFVPAVTTTTTTKTTKKTMVNVVATTQIDDLTWDRDETIWKEERTFDASHMHLKFNRCSSKYTYTTFSHCYPSATIQYTQHHRWLQSNGTEKQTTNRTNNYLCRFVVRQEKCCSSFKAANPLRSSHSVFDVVFFSFGIFNMKMASDRIYRFVSFLLLLPMYRISIDFFPLLILILCFEFEWRQVTKSFVKYF